MPNKQEPWLRRRLIEATAYAKAYGKLTEAYENGEKIAIVDKDQLECVLMTLEFYANKENWKPTEYMEPSAAERDGGHRARRAFEALCTDI